MDDIFKTLTLLLATLFFLLFKLIENDEPRMNREYQNFTVEFRDF